MGRWHEAAAFCTWQTLPQKHWCACLTLDREGRGQRWRELTSTNLQMGCLKKSVMWDTITGDDGEIQDADDDGLVDDVSTLTEDKRKNLLATIKPVKMALMKVDLIYLLDWWHWIHLCAAEMPGLQNHPFNNNCPFSMEGNTGNLGAWSLFDAVRCGYLLELIRWYGGFCNQLSRGYWGTYPKEKSWAESAMKSGLFSMSCVRSWRWVTTCKCIQIYINKNLQILKDATLYFSRASPNLATVIPAMDHTDKEFTTYVLDASSYSPPIWAALEMAKKTLNHCYARMDESHLYHIAMGKSPIIWHSFIHFFLVLHPRHKLSYFRKVKWLDCWIKQAENLVCEEFEHSYSSYHCDTEMADITSDDQSEKNSNVFDSLEALAPPKLLELGSELDCYLNTDVEHVMDALAWWHEHCAVYPCLMKMVLDYLSIPGKSTLLIINCTHQLTNCL